jgi:hypothetical protein
MELVFLMLLIIFAFMVTNANVNVLMGGIWIAITSVIVRASAIVVMVVAMAMVMGIIGIGLAIAVLNGDSSLTDNIFQLLPKLKDMSQTERLSLFIVFFYIMPMSNALIDSLSLSVSRYEFQKLLDEKAYSFPFFLKISLVDFLYALVFKLLVLGVLYIGAYLFQNTGGTFQVSDMDIYFNSIIKAIFQDGSFSFLFTGSTNTMITLMISTTLLPTIIHFVSVLINTIWAFLANSIQLFGLFFRGNGIFFSAVMSVVFLLSLLLLFFIIFYMMGSPHKPIPVSFINTLYGVA